MIVVYSGTLDVYQKYFANVAVMSFKTIIRKERTEEEKPIE
jgi:hypothetical protein